LKVRIGKEKKFQFVKVVQVFLSDKNTTDTFFAVLRVRFGFSAEPDPAFCLYADPDPRSRTNQDPYGSKFGSWPYLAVTKAGFDMKNLLF
jgi:hypothetical protein